MAEKEEKDVQSYRKLCQFWGVLELIENDDVYIRFLDQLKVNRELEIIIKAEGDINYQFSRDDDIVTLRHPELAGCTALHLAVGRQNEILQVLLSRPGIDLTIKNTNGSTALHEVVVERYHHYKGHWQMRGTLENKTVDAILLAHIELDVSQNPCDKNGLSHFHVACMANNVKAVEYFISKGAPVNQAAVGDSCPILGYTPLHFAVICCALETVQVLLRHGADINRKDAKGMSPVHLLLEKNITIVDLIHTANATSAWHYWQIPDLISHMDKSKTIMESLVLHVITSVDDSNFDVDNLTAFHLACTLGNTQILEQLLTEIADINHCVKMDSRFWPGYTAAHFAAHFDMEILRFLLQYEANVDVQDANGLSPFDICLETYKVQDIHCILSSNPAWRDLLLTDNKTKLSDVICAMQDSSRLADFLKDAEPCQSLTLPNDSPLWPGYTLLHLAVSFTETIKRIADSEGDYRHEDLGRMEREYIARIEVCLKYGADVTVQDARGWTALHLAHRLQKARVVKLILEEHGQIANPINEENLSHLYIACAFDCPRLVNQLLLNHDVDVNLAINSRVLEWRPNQRHFARRHCKEAPFSTPVGSTPLHAAVISKSAQLVKILLEHGADVNAKDSNGLTPVHYALACDNSGKNIGEIVLSSPDIEEYTVRGLNYLHLAAEFRSEEDVIEKFVKLGVDINSTIDYYTEAEEADSLPCPAVNCRRPHLAEPFAFMASFSKLRPIDIAIHRNHKEVVKILLKRGADIFAPRPDAWTVLRVGVNGGYCGDTILAAIKCNVTLQQLMQSGTGITMLHLACKKGHFDDVEYHLKNGANVNAQVKFDSPLWPGHTPMHVLAEQAYGEDNQVLPKMRLLLENGADVTLTNFKKNTPIHIAFTYDVSARLHFTELLLNGLTNFNVNPTNNQGVSHFHIACLRSNLAVMEQFLKCRVKVNQPVALHSEDFPGCTPLHLVLQPDSAISNDVRVAVIDFLIKQGANPHATDLYGNNLFHAVSKCASPRIQLLETIFSIGTSIDAKNVFGEEPLGMLLSSTKFEYKEVKFFLDHNCHANIYDPIRKEGYLKYLFKNDHPIRKIAKHPSITKIDDFGRNAIHNIVSWEWASTKSYYQIIPMLMDRGCNVDHQDKLGWTPLHLAVKFSNSTAVVDLLGAGADINLTDANGKTPFSHVISLSRNSEWHQYEYNCCHMYKPMAMHIRKLQITGLYVSELNSHALEELLKKCSLDPVKVERANNELTKMKNLKIESTQLSPHDFFSETGAIAAYPYMPLLEQQALDTFFTSIKKRDFAELGYLLKIRYGKALRRPSLLSPAKVGLDILMRCALPEKCSRHILRFLSNSEIENVIVSANLVLPQTYCLSLPKIALINKKLKCI